MVDTVGRHGPNERHLVDHLLEIRKQLRNLAATFTAIREFPGTGHDLLRAVQRPALDFEWRRFAVIPHQRGLGIEHVNRAWSAADVDEDDSLGLRWKVRLLRPEIVD